MRKLSGCNVDNCPTTWLDHDGTVVVQGPEAAVTGVLGPAPDGELRVRVPRAILEDAARKLATG